MQQSRLAVGGTTRASVLMPTTWAGEGLVVGMVGLDERRA